LVETGIETPSSLLSNSCNELLASKTAAVPFSSFVAVVGLTLRAQWPTGSVLFFLLLLTLFYVANRLCY
jgi:hypothetical protein